MKKLLIILLSLALVFAFAACGQPAETPAETPAEAPAETPAEAPAAPVAEEVKGVTIPEFSVTINGVAVDNTAMAAYPVYSVQATSVNSSGTESTTTYIGFAMKDVLAAAGLNEAYIWLEATADDGYAVTFLGDVLAPEILLAISKDGSQFATAPWFAPCVSQVTGDYLKNCVSILVNTTESAPEIQAAPGGEETPAELALTGDAPDKQDKTDKVTFDAFSFKVNGAEVTNATLEGLSIYKVTTVTENSKGALSESTYTGYVLADVLQACGVTDFTAVQVVANDGYTSDLSAELAASEFTIVALEKDKELGEDGTIWVAPCTEPSSKNYSKLVVEIIAE